MFDRFFRLRGRGTSVRTEVLGGATTFVTMACIIVVNPAILAAIGIPTGPSTVATILAVVIGLALILMRFQDETKCGTVAHGKTTPD